MAEQKSAIFALPLLNHHVKIDLSDCLFERFAHTLRANCGDLGIEIWEETVDRNMLYSIQYMNDNF
jgi:hypothetical protein